ncbi:MAG: amidohydrolase family protein [Chloroflexi bacterium]|nr:amidohydrolase family protein [Chloroflexota bacterium]
MWMVDVMTSGPDARLSGDSHVSEPPDLWVKGLPPRFRNRALQFPRVAYGKFNHSRPGGWDPVERLKDMAADGIAAEVLYPTLAKGIFEQFFHQPFDPDLAKACERVYNDWMIEFCQAAPDRLWGQAFIGLWDIDYAIQEMQRTQREGLKGVATWIAPPDELPWTGDHYERFWSAAEEMRVPIGFHINTGFGAYVTRHHESRFESVSRQAYGHKVVAMQAMAEMILSGVFERHPRLTVVLAEFDCGWIPFFLEDLDRKFGRGKELGLSMLPSEYFSRSVFSTMMQDGVGGFLLQRWGADNFVYANDYPHAGGIWPHTDDTFELVFSALPVPTRRKVLAENLARAYGQPLPDPLPRQPFVEMDGHWNRPWLKRAGAFTFDKPKMGLAV